MHAYIDTYIHIVPKEENVAVFIKRLNDPAFTEHDVV